MYLVQTIGRPPRAWSSHLDISAKDDIPNKMNSVDDISGYRDISNIYCSPTVFRTTAATTYDFPEHPPKKDKKWSLGSLFRRKKKEDSDSTSDEDCDKKGFLRRKKKEKRKKTNKQRGTFDHIVVTPAGGRGVSSTVYNGYSLCDEGGILSDPTGGFDSYTGRDYITKQRAVCVNGTKGRNLKSTADCNEIRPARTTLGSADSLIKKNRKNRTKVRAEARRDHSKCDSSSDEDSQRSTSSLRFRSDDNLGRSCDTSLNRRSRAARTERYIRRLSKDEEGISNRGNIVHSSKSDFENCYRQMPAQEENINVNKSPTKSPVLYNNSEHKLSYAHSAPISQKTMSGLSTIPPSHGSYGRNKSDNCYISNICKPHISNCNDVSKYNSLVNDNKNKEINYQRSVSYDADIHKSATPELPDEIFHVQFALGKPNHRLRNLSLVEQPRICKGENHPPPPPPPRDPWRLVSVPHYDNTRPMSYCFERTLHQNNPNSNYTSKDLLNKGNGVKSYSFNWHSNYRSASEDHLASESSHMPLQPRPASAASDNYVQRFIRRHPQNTRSSDEYHYLTDKNPRSRKPILIQSSNSGDDHTQANKQQSDPQKALNFWKQKDQDELNRALEKQTTKKPLPSSTQIFTAQTRVTTNIFLPSVLKMDIETNADKAGNIKRASSPFKPIAPSLTGNHCSNDKDSCIKDAFVVKSKPNEILVDSMSQKSVRKSSNLEDALDELEAIYNSLRLGDEDLLERAEQRELSMAAKKLLDSKAESYPGWKIPRGTISDSSFSYEPFDLVDSPKRKRLVKRSRPVDRKCDDMAYRKLNKERPITSSVPKEAASKVSYLLASPVHGSAADEIDFELSKNDNKEPDITFDDMVYRNVKHANSTLKVSEPQPPFGIPVGPILPAANSDYLHAVPETTQRYSFRSKRVPDIVKDDLAFRNLRKDSHKDPILPPLTSDDFVNNNNNSISLEMAKPDFTSLKKKRAVRSLSANIYNLIQNQPFPSTPSEESILDVNTNKDELEKSSLTDIADAMEIARQILKEKEDKINATKRAFLSDTEAKYRRQKTTCSESLNEHRLNFLNGMRSRGAHETLQQRIQVNVPKVKDNYLHSKPPRGMTPDKKTPTKEISPISLISVEHARPLKEYTQVCASSESEVAKMYHKSSLEDLLTAFAVEAHETSEQITNELKELECNIDRNSPLGSKSYDKDNMIPKVDEVQLTLESHKNEEADVLLSESLNDCEVADLEMLATTKTESTPIEEVEQITPAATFPQSVANIIITRNADQVHLSVDPVTTEIHSESEHDYVNVGSDAEAEKAIPLIDEENRCKSPFEEQRLGLIAGFQKLIKVSNAEQVKNDIVPCKSEADILEGGDSEDGKAGEGEKCDLKCDALTPEKQECAFLAKSHVNISENGTITSYISNCDIDCKDKRLLPKIILNEIKSYAKFVNIQSNVLLKCDSVCNRESNVNSLSTNVHCQKSLLNNTDYSNGPQESSGFHSYSSCNSVSDAEPNLYLTSNDDDGSKFENLILTDLESLESPKLVLKSTFIIEQNANKNYDVSSPSGRETTSMEVSENKDSFSDKTILTNCSKYNATFVQHAIFESRNPEYCNDDINLSVGKKENESSVISKNTNIKTNHEKQGHTACSNDTKFMYTDRSSQDSEKRESSASHDSRHTLDRTQATSTWYNDPIVLAFACSYGFACTYQLVSMDVVAVLGLLFVIISFVAALIL